MKYYFLSNNTIKGNPTRISPVLVLGKGLIDIHDSGTLGYHPSPGSFDTSIYLEARCDSSKIIIAENVFINNCCTIIAERTSIHIGPNCLIGPNVKIFDSDFHNLQTDKRTNGIPESRPVEIGSNVFIGASVIILKGVSIGENTVIAAGSVVTKSFGDNVIIGGNPAKLLRKLES